MRLLTSVTLVCLSVFAHAADDFDFKVANIEILQDKNVQKDLGVTDAQRNTMNSYVAKANEAGKAKSDEYQKAKRKIDQAFINFATEQRVNLRTNILKTLTAAQLKRLREITIRAVGPRALADPNIATRVGMTRDEHKKFITALQEGDQKIAKIKGEVGKVIQAKYKDVKKPTTKKEADDLQGRINRDLAAEMKKHDAEMKAIISTSEKKTDAIVKKQYKDGLLALMGKPFNVPKPGGAPAKPPTSSSSFSPKPSGKKG